LGGFMVGQRPSVQWLQPQIVVPQVAYHQQQMMFGANRHSRSKQLDHYSIFLDQPVGAGSFSVVYRSKDNRNGEEVCVKVVECAGISQAQKNMMLRESKFLRQLSHPNILRLLDVMDKGTQFYLVTEYCPQGDLYQKIMAEGAMPEYFAFHMMKGVANALLALKKAGIVHRDLKPSNVLLKDGLPKLADFGFAIHESQAREEALVNVGSPLYMAPEVLFGNRYSFASDMFAFGIMYYELLHMATPWESLSEEELKVKLSYNYPVVFREGIGAGVKQLIMACLQKDPRTRPTIEQVMACFH